MQNEDDLRSLAKIMDFGRAVSIFLLTVHVYVYCYPTLEHFHLTLGVIDRIILNFNRTTGIFDCILWSKLAALLLLAISCWGTQGVKGEKITWGRIFAALISGTALFFLNWWILDLPLPHTAVTALYVFTLGTGYLCLLMAGLWMSRLYKHNLMKDVFNEENESFMQETRLMENEYSVNLPTRFQYQGKMHDGWINIVNPFRASIVLGTPGSGKSYAVVNNYIRQMISKGFALYLYDYKFDDLSTIAYNTLLHHTDKYRVKPQFYVINFDDPRRSHRCNPINPEFMTDISDAYEASYTILLNLNRTWIEKQGQNIQRRNLLHLSPCGGTSEQALFGTVHHIDLVSRTGKLSFSLHGRLERECPGPASGADCFRQDSADPYDFPAALLGDDRQRFLVGHQQSERAEDTLRGQQPG